MNSNSFAPNILVLALMVLVFFGGINIGGISFSVNFILFFWLVVRLILCLSLKDKIEVDYNLSLFTFVLVIMFLMSILSFIIKGFDYDFLIFQLKKLVLSALNTIGFYLLLKMSIRNWNDDVAISVAKMVSLFSFLSLLLYLVQVSSGSFQQFYIENFSLLEGDWKNFALNSFRGSGWQGLSIWDTSIAFSLLSLLLYPLLLNHTRVNTFLWSLSIICLFCILLISGRTGLMFFLCFTLFQFFYSQRFVLMTIFVLCLAIVCFFLIAYFGDDVLFYFNFAFELFVNFFSNKGFNSASTNDLIDNHLYIPVMFDVIFGDNYYINDLSINGNRPSDSTFVINFISHGLFGIAFTMVLMVLFFCLLYNSVSNLLKRRSAIVFCFIFLVTMFVFVKAPPYYSQTFLKAVTFLVFAGNSCKYYRSVC